LLLILSFAGALYFYVPSYDQQRVERIVQQVDETLSKRPKPSDLMVSGIMLSGEFDTISEELTKEEDKDYALSDAFYDDGPLDKEEVRILDEIVLKKPELVRAFLNPKAVEEKRVKDIHPFNMLDYSKFLLAYADLLEARKIYDQSWEILLQLIQFSEDVISSPGLNMLQYCIAQSIRGSAIGRAGKYVQREYLYDADYENVEKLNEKLKSADRDRVELLERIIRNEIYVSKVKYESLKTNKKLLEEVIELFRGDKFKMTGINMNLGLMDRAILAVYPRLFIKKRFNSGLRDILKDLDALPDKTLSVRSRCFTEDTAYLKGGAVIVGFARYIKEQNAYPRTLKDMIDRGYIDTPVTDPYDASKDIDYSISGTRMSITSVGSGDEVEIVRPRKKGTHP
jgi:hypothetical protein